MKTLSEIRTEARKSLTGKWGKGALIVLVYSLITYAISWVLAFIPVVGSIGSLVIELPITYGFLISMVKLKRGEEIGYVDFLTIGFTSFAKVWTVFGNILLKMIIPVILYIVSVILIVVGVGLLISQGTSALIIIGYILLLVASIWATIKGLYYAPSFFILYDNPDMSGKEIVEESEKIMTGNRFRFFVLPLTFIGWILLCGLTLGIGSLWLTPYMMVSMVVFYESIAGTKSNVEATAEATETPAE